MAEEASVRVNAPVALVGCDEYSPEAVGEALDRAMALIGGWEAFVSPGEKVLLKVNLVAARDPSQGATTHPVFVAEVAKRLKNLGCEVIIGDSPGGLFNPAKLKKVYHACGMDKAAELSGAELCYDTDTVDIDWPTGTVLKHFTVTHMVRSADKIISLSKIKTHGMMTYTGVTKNMFGSIPGTSKPELHMRLSETMDFANALLDIWEANRPVLSLMDGILGMEGNGPTNGKPRKIGVLMASSDAPALDLAAAHLIGLEAEGVPMLSAAVTRGMIPNDYKALTLVGDDVEKYVIPDFEMPEHINPDLINKLFPVGTKKLGKTLLRPRVHFDATKCIGCGECAADCPAKVLTMKPNKKAGHKVPSCDYKNCIRCYCCQELCPRGAVSVKQSVIYKVANKL